MKNSIIIRNLIMGLIFTGLTAVGFAQEKTVELDEVEVLGVNYKYLDALGDGDVALSVKSLEQKVAKFDIKSLAIYEDVEKDYYVFFNIPEGKILAVYDDDGEIIRTSEKFNDIRLPLVVFSTITGKYPGWNITGDIYKVSYLKDKEIVKSYKLFIEKDGKHKRIITDENGNFI